MDLISVFSQGWVLFYILAGALIVAAIAFFAPADVEYPNHKRVPNPIVRAFYSVGFFIADFGPMIVNLFNVVYINLRKLFAFIVGLLIEIGTVLVLISTIYFSFSHSVELLRRAGATGGLEYVGVLMWEIVFISSTASLTKIAMQKTWKVNWWYLGFSLAGFALGIAFVLWSNITGMSDTTGGLIIGIFTPVLLIVAEGVLAFRYKSEFEEEEEKKSNTSNMEMETSNKVESNSKVEVENSSKLETSNDVENTSSQIEASNQLEVENASKLENSTTVESDSKTELETSNKQDMESPSNSENTLESKDSPDMETTSNKVENSSNMEEKVEEENSNQVDTTTSNKVEEQPEVVEEENSSKEDMTSNVEAKTSKLETSSKAKKSSKKTKMEAKSSNKMENSILEMKVENPTSPVEWAIYLHQRDGELPGRPTLMKKSGCSDWIARKTLSELKSKIS
ncbi:MFS transporter [Risungbinella massiliensis]|uniref:MFS transporter n=1 Tax=Risungbinella massiliensis TaxID=1329796 RepID=UPI0005CC0EB3|nr:MFS transporter [Risungbinella massiliensis]